MISENTLFAKNSIYFVLTMFFSLVALSLIVVDFDNWAGWLIMGLSFWVLLFRPIRGNLLLYTVCCLLLILYHAVSFINLNIVSLNIANADAQNFIQSAQQIMDGLFGYYCVDGSLIHFVGACYYSHFLSSVYTFNNSVFFGQEINVFAVALSMVYLSKFTKLLKIENYTIAIILFFSLLPQYLFWRAITLREAWEVLLFMALLYHGLVYRLEKKSILYLLWIIFLCSLTSVWHNVFLVYVPILFLLIILFPFDSWFRFSFERFLVNYGLIWIVGAIVASVGLYFFVLAPHTVGVDSSVALDVGNIGYTINRDWSTPFSIVKTLFLDIYYYLFTPMPWQVKSIAEFFIMMYVFLRIILLVLIIRNYKNLLPSQKRIYTWFLIIYFSFSLIWAIGTFNYGQAIRHQMITDWIIIMLGVPILLSKLGYLLNLKLICRNKT
jgi:hypothetical protein